MDLGLAVANVALNIASTVPALWLLTTERLVNPEALEAVDWPWGGSGPVLASLAVTLVIVGAT